MKRLDKEDFILLYTQISEILKMCCNGRVKPKEISLIIEDTQ
jgi:hypothetical protein